MMGRDRVGITSATMALATAQDPDALTTHIEANADNGLLLLAQSTGWFAALQAAPPPEKPVLFALALQRLDDAAKACPGYARIEELRVAYTRLETPWGSKKAFRQASRKTSRAVKRCRPVSPNKDSLTDS